MTPESKETIIIRKKKEKGEGKRAKGEEEAKTLRSAWKIFSLQPGGGTNAACLLVISANLSLSTATAVSVLTDAMQ